LEKNRLLFVKLYPEISNLTRDNPPIASFIIRVVSSAGDRKALTHPGKLQIKVSFDMYEFF
jgi:speckle-type POZ protein